MQPMLIVQSEQPGLLYLNGAFCGELAEPLAFPVRADSRVFLELRPLGEFSFPVALALNFQDGTLQPPLPAIAYAVQWPDHITELELRPLRLPNAPPPESEIAALPFAGGTLRHRRLDGEDTLDWTGTPVCTLPEGAHGLRLQNGPQPGLHLLWGECDAGDCALLLSEEQGTPVAQGRVVARQITAEPDGTLRALETVRDSVGHARTVLYQPGRDGLTELNRQPAWEEGGPRWPRTPEETLRAYLEALQLGLTEEASRYLTAPAAAKILTPPVVNAVVPLPRPLLQAPEGCPLALGALRLEAPNLGRVRAVCAHAIPGQHAQGAYQLDQVVWEA